MDKREKVHKFKKDRYVKTRGGNSHFLDLYCSNCNQHILLYQKDGQGSLLRLYLDRIFEPQELAILQSTCNIKSQIPNLKCGACQKLIAIPMVYKPENRLAFSLVPGSFIKKKSEGVYPPKES
jgi:hypothetical protein